MNLLEFKARVAYQASSRTAWATKRKPVSEKKENKNKRKRKKKENKGEKKVISPIC